MIATLATNPAIYREARVLEPARGTTNRQHLVWKPRWEENETIVDRLNFDKSGGFFTSGDRINSQSTTRKRFRQPVKVINNTY
jgi:hypothetical protein